MGSFAVERLKNTNSLARVDVLTPREAEVFRLLACTTDSRKQAAYRLGISRHTLEVHLNRIHAKLGVHSRAELILRYNGLR
jgi:DNA-binding CsgD family transcriptional regulator